MRNCAFGQLGNGHNWIKMNIKPLNLVQNMQNFLSSLTIDIFCGTFVPTVLATLPVGSASQGESYFFIVLVKNLIPSLSVKAL